MVSRPPQEQSFVDSTATLASLYQSPLAEFTARRAAVVAQLKRSGHKDVAVRIAAAGKPSRAAHLVNQVFWQARAVYDAVLDAGTAARAAQQARLLGDAAIDLNETLRDRDDAVRAAVQAALGVAAVEGQGASDAVSGQLRASFEALAAHGLEGRLAHGHFTTDVALPGMAAFAGLVLPASSDVPNPVRRFEVVARRSEPAGASESVAVAPDPRIAEAEASVERLRERRAGASDRVEALRRSTAAAQEVATTAEQAAADAARKAVEARHAVERAEASCRAAELALQRVEQELSGAEAQLRELQVTPT